MVTRRHRAEGSREPTVGGRPRRRARELGQNFLVDRNMLEVIARLAELGPADIVLEIGGGSGLLSRRLAERAQHVHVVEVDRALEPRLRAELAGLVNVTLHMADALELDLTGLDPPPDKVVANLPYAIAATAILRTIEQLPRVRSWLVMVQREVGERLAAAPGTSAYGAPSVLAQLACEVRLLRAVPRTVFRPVPHVDSVLVGLRRTRPAPEPAVRRLVNDAFGHRRKTLAGSLALAPGAPPGVRERAREALGAIGRPPDERAERLSPPEFVELHRRLAE
jgi:16S rRNA (adenine1518-N6/adenine1519-N6)-dimethyltransferase